jgi:D-alanine--poly(phosphoribitol) ligase subunit 2
MSVAESVLNALVEVSRLDEVRTNLDVRLYDTHILDSLSTVELMILLGERLGVEVSPAEFDRELWATPGKMIRYFESRLAT